MVRFGLCCIFHEEPIKFFSTTATSIAKMPRADALAKLSRLCLANAHSLMQAFQYCVRHHIGCFRVNSQILPIYTHPGCGYVIEDLPEADEIIHHFKLCGEFARKNQLRSCFHPDQFVVLNSQRKDVVEKSILELEYQAQVADWIGADVLNIHGGGAFGDKQKALAQLVDCIRNLSPEVRSRLTLENDDKLYSPSELLPVCLETGIPLVYDVHHHRCLPDSLSLEEATIQALATWDREPLFHLSSPKEGWGGPKPERHHDYIDVNDFPEFWKDLEITVEIEAKFKEVAILKLQQDLADKKVLKRRRGGK